MLQHTAHTETTML